MDRVDTYPLVDEHGGDEDEDQEDNDEDDNNTGLALSPVLLALHQLVDSVFAAGDEGHVEGGHCELLRFCREKMISSGSDNVCEKVFDDKIPELDLSRCETQRARRNAQGRERPSLARTTELGFATRQTDAAQLLQGNQWGAYIHEVNRSGDGMRQSSLKEVELG
jgi:hypothetical protein